MKANIPLGIIPREFHHTLSIHYPFGHEPYLKTRYGNGSYGVWYGALALDTTIHETACDPVRRSVTVERTVGQVMSTLQF